VTAQGAPDPPVLAGTPGGTSTALNRTAAAPGRWLPAAAVLVVAALAITVAVLMSDRRDQPATGRSGVVGVVGYHWRITTVADSQGTVSVPPALRPQVGFTRMQVSGDDTLNALFAAYRPTPDGYALRGGAGTTLVGYDGRDPIRVRIIGAVDELFFATGGRAPVRVVARVHGDILTLHRGEVTVSARRAGRQPEPNASHPEPTSLTRTQQRR
jgi:hypothetical protein